MLGRHQTCQTCKCLQPDVQSDDQMHTLFAVHMADEACILCSVNPALIQTLSSCLINSVLHKGCLNIQGYLYIEAHKESHVTDATKGLRIIYHSKGARLVPLKEMVSAIYVNRQAKSQLGMSATISDIHSGCPSMQDANSETRLYCTCPVHYPPPAILCFCSKLSRHVQKTVNSNENKSFGLVNICQVCAAQVGCLQTGFFR